MSDMSPEAAELLRSARELSRDDIGALAHGLLLVLDEGDGQLSQAEYEEAWAKEIHRRIDEIENDPSVLVDGRESLEKLRASLKQSRA